MVFPRGFYCGEYLMGLEWHKLTSPPSDPCISGCDLLFLGYGIRLTFVPWIGPCAPWPLSCPDLWPPESRFSESGHWSSFPFIHRTLLSIKDKVTLESLSGKCMLSMKAAFSTWQSGFALEGTAHRSEPVMFLLSPGIVICSARRFWLPQAGAWCNGRTWSALQNSPLRVVGCGRGRKHKP